jgi:hypothetical protein
MEMGGEGTSDNEEEDTEDVATVDGIDESGDKKPTAKTLSADSEPGNNNEDGTNPTVAMAKGGAPTMKKNILMTLPQSMISTKVEKRNPPPKHWQLTPNRGKTMRTARTTTEMEIMRMTMTMTMRMRIRMTIGMRRTRVRMRMRITMRMIMRMGMIILQLPTTTQSRPPMEQLHLPIAPR